MIEELKGTPNTMVGFRLASDTTQNDFDSIVLPSISELVKRIDKLNYLLIVEYPATNFEIAIWTKDALIRLNQLNKWNRTAVVSSSKDMNGVIETFKKDIPGECKLFESGELDNAITWVAEYSETESKEKALQEEETFD